MDTNLFIASAATWIFWAALFAFRQRVEQMYSAGFGSGNTSFLKIISFLLGIVFLNFIIFFVAHGIQSSWFGSATIVIGGYLTSILFVFALRFLGLNLGFVNSLARIALVAMPFGAVSLWFLS